MSNYEQKKFVKIIVNQLNKLNNFKNMTVLDVGSYDVGGSIKEFFHNNYYLGVDLIKGPNVDVVLDGSQLEKLNKKFDIKKINETIKLIKNRNRKMKIFRIILSYLLNDINYQNFTFLRRKVKKFFTKKDNG